MNTPIFMITYTTKLLLALICVSMIGTILHAKKEKSPPRTTIYSEVNETYQRERLPNGLYKTETYALGKGKLLDHGTDDQSLNNLSFTELSQILANALYEEQYVATTTPEETDILIIVSWGRTDPNHSGLGDLAAEGMSDALATVIDAPTQNASGESISPEDAAARDQLDASLSKSMMMQQMADRERWESNNYNANLIGYSKQLREYNRFPLSASNASDFYHELENPRYFVILQAFDFQSVWKAKKKQLLWVTKFSIRTKGNQFDEDILSMVTAASNHFGKNSDGLERLRIQGKVIFGELEYLGEEAEE